MSEKVESTRTVPVPRDPGIAFANVPRHWLAGSALATAVANGVNLLFPAGERFFVRSVHKFKDQVRSPELKEQVKGFSGQEGRHARETEKVFRILEAQGYDLERFLKLYERIAYGLIERVSPEILKLSTTAACEHYTAIMAENALSNRLLDEAHPAMRDLLLWHAAEEIEHRAVAFDVLQEVNPSYAWRMAGLAMATATLGGFWLMGTTALLLQEEELDRSRLWRELKQFAERRQKNKVFLRGLRSYMRKDFHPLQSDTDRLATEYLASVGLA